MPIPDFIVELRKTIGHDFLWLSGVTDAVEREILEEASVQARAVRLAAVKSGSLSKHANGDLAAYLDLTFECEWISGEGEPDDEETTAVGWFAMDDLPPISDVMLKRVRTVVEGTGTAFTRAGEQTTSS